MSQTDHWIAYVGSRTTRERHAQGRGLAVFSTRGEGTWTHLQTVEGLRNPSFLCAHPDLPVLYAVHGDFSEISVFGIEPTGRLQQHAELDTWGRNPVHLSLSHSLAWMLVANYASGNVVTMKVGEDGLLGRVAHRLALSGTCGPHPQQDGSHPHQVCPAPSGTFFGIPDKGLDQVFTLALNEDTGSLSIAAALPLPAGTGPRHMLWHPTLPIAYIVGELSRSVVGAHWNPATGELTPLFTASTVPPGCSSGSAAGIALSATGDHLFISNRGHDSVAAFPVAADGRLGTPTFMAAGQTPRFIGLDPSGQLLVAREDGHSIAVLRGEPPTAEFQDITQTGSPVCITFKRKPS